MPSSFCYISGISRLLTYILGGKCWPGHNHDLERSTFRPRGWYRVPPCNIILQGALVPHLNQRSDCPGLILEQSFPKCVPWNPSGWKCIMPSGSENCIFSPPLSFPESLARMLWNSWSPFVPGPLHRCFLVHILISPLWRSCCLGVGNSGTFPRCRWSFSTFCSLFLSICGDGWGSRRQDFLPVTFLRP